MKRARVILHYVYYSDMMTIHDLLRRWMISVDYKLVREDEEADLFISATQIYEQESGRKQLSIGITSMEKFEARRQLTINFP